MSVADRINLYLNSINWAGLPHAAISAPSAEVIQFPLAHQDEIEVEDFDPYEDVVYNNWAYHN